MRLFIVPLLIGLSACGDDTNTADVQLDTGPADEVDASTEIDATTSEVDATTSEVDATTSEVDATTSEVDDTTSEVDATTSEVDATTSEVDATTSEDDATASEVDAITEVDADTEVTEDFGCLSTPRTGVRIELWWPGIASGGFSGPDMDLHLLRWAEGVDYFDRFYDLFWDNHEPAWAPDACSNDQSLTTEVIALPSPEAGQRYCVGVQYWEDQGVGPQDANVKIYLDGTVALEANASLVRDNLWQITCFTWPTTSLELMRVDGELDIRNFLPAEYYH